MIYFAVLIGVVLICILIAPFFAGPGGLLQAGSSINSPERLRAFKEAVLKRYLEDEQATRNGSLSAFTWEKRKAFLINRYIDASRRLDFLEGVAKTEGAA